MGKRSPVVAVWRLSTIQRAQLSSGAPCVDKRTTHTWYHKGEKEMIEMPEDSKYAFFTMLRYDNNYANIVEAKTYRTKATFNTTLNILQTAGIMMSLDEPALIIQLH